MPDTSPWASLREELLELLLRRLFLADYIRFGAVCKQWNRVFVKCCRPKVPELVWTAPYKGHFEEGYRRFYSPSENRYYDLNLPQWGEHCYCIGSHKGWLIVVHEQSHIAALLNPFTGVHLELNLPMPLESMAEHKYNIALSLPPNDPRCVAALVRGHSELYISSPMRHQVSNGIRLLQCIHDVIFYKGSLFILCGQGELIRVDIAFSNVDDVGTCVFNPRKVLDSLIGLDAFFASRFNLFEFGGHLILLSYFESESEFLAFGPDFQSGEWMQYESLGSRLIFGSEGCKSLIADPPSGFTRDSTNGKVFRQRRAEDYLLVYSSVPYDCLLLTPNPW